jgi:hypothetical protein
MFLLEGVDLGNTKLPRRFDNMKAGNKCGPQRKREKS